MGYASDAVGQRVSTFRLGTQPDLTTGSALNLELPPDTWQPSYELRLCRPYATRNVLELSQYQPPPLSPWQPSSPFTRASPRLNQSLVVPSVPQRSGRRCSVRRLAPARGRRADRGPGVTHSVTASRAAGVVVAVCTVVAVVGCGAPSDGTRVIDGDGVPYALLSPSPPAGSVDETSGPGDVPAEVFFLDAEDLLVPVPFRAGGRMVEDLLPELLNELEEGPDDEERADGLGSALGPDVALRLVMIDGVTAHIEIFVATRQPAADRIPLAVGQIVLTVTSVAGIADVVLLIDGDRIDIALPGGERTPGPVTADQYDALIRTAPVP